jgi:hypothetical protein
MLFQTVSYELNQQYWFAILAILKSVKNSGNFSGYQPSNQRGNLLSTLDVHPFDFYRVSFPSGFNATLKKKFIE